MTSFSHRENRLLGYAPDPTSSLPRTISSRSSLLGYTPDLTSSSPGIIPSRSSDVDFNDVFGGPPRRSSTHEIRYSGGVEVNGPNEDKPEDEYLSCAWPRVLITNEKPVFGEECSHRKRNASDDFFDDIFGGDESPSSTPRRGHERESDPFVSSAPGSRGLSPARPMPQRPEPFFSSYLPSQFSLPARVTKGMDLPTFGSATRALHTKNYNFSKDGGNHSPTRSQDSKLVYRQSPLSQEVATSRDIETSSKETPEKLDEGPKSKPEMRDGNIQFHFSFYKWASKGVPFAMPLKQGKGRHVMSLISKEQLPTEASGKSSRSPSARSTLPIDNYESSPQVYEIPPRESEIEAAVKLSKVQPAPSIALQESTKPIQHDNVGSVQTRKEMSSDSADARGTSGSTIKAELRPLRSLLSENDDEGPSGDGEERKANEARESKTKNTKSAFVFNTAVHEKSQERKRNVPDAVNIDKFIPQVAESNPVKNPKKNSVRGKVNEFVRIFSQESSPKPEGFVISGSQDVTPSKSSSGEIQENLIQPDKEKAANATADPIIALNHSHEYTGISGATIYDTDQFSESNFQIKELTQEETNLLETQDSHEEFKAIDAKIRKWSNGKEGNIRSLLSTLQYVLWPGSGWKTVPLVDIIEGSSVKKAYQKALLCLHPDKLQQKGAATHHKYTAERVFDILQEAWDQFNLLGAL